MGKTVSQLTPEELKQYDPTRNINNILDPLRWEQAWEIVPKLAALLKGQYGAERVRVFGSLMDKDRYTRWSDIDIAVWGIAPANYYRAIGAVNDFAAPIKVDLVEPEHCSSPTLKQIIEEEGVDV